MVTGVGGGSRWKKKVKENRRYKLPVVKQISFEDIMYSLEKTVDSTVITLHSDRWALDSWRSHCKI